MSIKHRMLASGEGFLDRVLCVVGAVGFSQMPEFMQQYAQRLGGHLDEARRQLQQFRQVAEKSGLTLSELISRAATNPDAVMTKMGGVMTASVERVDHLAAAQAAIQGASLFERPWVFVRYMDAEIARATWSIFKPAVPTTAEGAVYALVGMLVLLTLYHGAVRYPIAASYRRRAMTRGVAGP